MKARMMIISLLLSFGISFTAKKAAKFTSETVSERSDVIKYKKIGPSSYFGLFGLNSRTQCSEVCLNKDSCGSFHMDDGACVFGVSGDVTVFEEDGVGVDPDGEQRIQTKSMY